MDYTASGIRHRVSVDMLDRVSGAVLGALDGVEAFSIIRNLYADVRGGGTMDVVPQEPIAWRLVAFRFWLELELAGEVERHPLLTAVPSLAGRAETATGVRMKPVLKDYTTLLDDVLGAHWAYPAGAVPTDEMDAILGLLGLSGRITPSTKTLRSPLTWEPTDTYRKVLTQLGSAIDYSAPWADSMGFIHLEPYIPPGERAPVFKLGHGGRSITAPEVEVEEKLEAPNHFVLTTSDENPLIAEGWNDDPDSPFSTVNQRVLPFTEQVDAADQATIDAKLADVMRTAVAADTTYTVSHRWFPRDAETVLELQDAGRLYWPARTSPSGAVVRDAVDAHVTIVGMSYSWAKGAPLSLVQTVLREAVA